MQNRPASCQATDLSTLPADCVDRLRHITVSAVLKVAQADRGLFPSVNADNRNGFTPRRKRRLLFRRILTVQQSRVEGHVFPAGTRFRIHDDAADVLRHLRGFHSASTAPRF